METTQEAAILDIITNFITAIELTFNTNRFKYDNELATEIRALAYEYINALFKLKASKDDIIELCELINHHIKRFERIEEYEKCFTLMEILTQLKKKVK